MNLKETLNAQCVLTRQSDQKPKNLNQSGQAKLYEQKY